jgi:hypothetical protein
MAARRSRQRRRPQRPVYRSDELVVPPWEGDGFARADLEFHGVEHDGLSFEARVFVGDARVDESTPRDAEHGYAGAFYVFGHGGCFGEHGHCHVPVGPLSAYDVRPSHQLTPQRKIVIATEPIKVLAEQGRDAFRVTVVPVVPASVEGDDDTVEDVLRFERLTLATYL